LKLRLISVGRERADPLAPMVADYGARLRKFVPFEEMVIRSDRADREEERILREAARADLLVALDEHGEQPDSRALARIVSGWMDRGVQTVALLIGGADGLPAAVLERAHLVLGLSRLTLPHRLARLVAVEQLYRAMCIIRNVPYQK
jgi:23S rRNA (pseudouridine1915-N3)-methyltransferase